MDATGAKDYRAMETFQQKRTHSDLRGSFFLNNFMRGGVTDSDNKSDEIWHVVTKKVYKQQREGQKTSKKAGTNH